MKIANFEINSKEKCPKCAKADIAISNQVGSYGGTLNGCSIAFTECMCLACTHKWYSRLVFAANARDL